MQAELDEQLCRKYPDFFADRHGSIWDTSMGWGFCCDKGWYALIDVVSALLTQHNAEIKAVQIKEKLGTLRFYHTHVDEYSRGVCVAAEILSSRICEVCGASLPIKGEILDMPIVSNGGGAFTRGMLDMFASYANGIDQLSSDI